MTIWHTAHVSEVNDTVEVEDATGLLIATVHYRPFESLIVDAPKAKAKVQELTQALLDIREYLKDIPCSGPCDSYGICALCSARSITQPY